MAEGSKSALKRVEYRRFTRSDVCDTHGGYITASLYIRYRMVKHTFALA